MDNFLPFTSSNAYSNQDYYTMDPNNNNNNYQQHFTTFPTHDHMLPPHPNVACPMMMNPQSYPEPFPQIPVNPTGSMGYNPGFMRGGFNDPLMTKMARINRKNAMIRSRNNNSNPNSSANELAEERRQMILKMKTIAQAAAKRDLYRYITFDNKHLRVLLEKTLKFSDVASLGRIVLPKRDAEGNLPEIQGKEGMVLEMRDANSTSSWSFKYKYWSNNKSRMYVLENTGEFVKKSGVEMGDTLTILEDENKNLYYSIRKSDKQDEGNQEGPMEVNEINVFDYMPNEEEEEDPLETLFGNMNQLPIPEDFMSLEPFDFENPLDPRSFPTMDHQVTDPRHAGSSSDHMNLNGFHW